MVDNSLAMDGYIDVYMHPVGSVWRILTNKDFDTKSGSKEAES